jgi:hypothetical protein
MGGLAEKRLQQVADKCLIKPANINDCNFVIFDRAPKKYTAALRFKIRINFTLGESPVPYPSLWPYLHLFCNHLMSL